ncbi:MAG: UDP-N-acetylmuramate dehydrogenase [Nitrospinae bacterium]|nr:UDP-N-acetylmuramate dehydrogenase [Nitrospinota bacterium]
MKIENYDLKKTNTFQVGGKARWALLPETLHELQEELKKIQEEKIRFQVIGYGSNVLISDSGYDGVIIILKNMQEANDFNWLEKGKRFVAGAYLSLKKVSNQLVKVQCPDFIKLSTIPGTLGGCIKMNAGCYGVEISDFIEGATVISQKNGIQKMCKDELGLAYRHSELQQNQVVISATFNTRNVADEASLKEEMNEMKQKRKNQPTGTKNAGSVFKNGKNYFAAKLIDEAGLKGFSCGDAEVSHKHANFIINKGKASAKDIYTLITDVENRVFEKFGIRLQREIELVGDF